MTPAGRALMAALLLSLVAAAAGPAANVVAEVMELRSAAVRERRALVNGRIYQGAMSIDSALPAGVQLAVIPRGITDWDRVMLFDYYVYPRPTRAFGSLNDYRNDPKRPDNIVYIIENARLLPYHAIRDEEMYGRRIVADQRMTSTLHDGGTHFVLPMAASSDGPAPDAYTVEGMLVSAAPAAVRVTLRPSGVVREVTVSPERPLIFYDLVHQVFGTMDVGWLEVDSTAPVRGSFWFVNRGTRTFTPLEIVTTMPSGPLRIASGTELWLLNLTAKPTAVTACGTSRQLGAYALSRIAATFPCRVDGAYAFSSRKVASGDTEFAWPEALP
jgi:hypothetical protein